MGEARLRRMQERPEHPAGPRGHNYYCKARCGTVVFRKDTNHTFVERKHPLWGLCRACIGLRMNAVAEQVVVKICEQAKTQVEALQMASSVRLMDDKIYNLSEAVSSMPAFKELPTGVQLGTEAMTGRCATMFRHTAHDQCDGNPDGLVDPAVPAT